MSSNYPDMKYISFTLSADMSANLSSPYENIALSYVFVRTRQVRRLVGQHVGTNVNEIYFMWKESTLTLTYESSKTAWPVSQLESYFLPEFPVVSCFNDKKFEILEEISKGAFGRVYKVRNSEKENTFALKILSKSKIISEYSVQQVKDEVHIQRLCGHHPYIASYFSHWQSKRCLYIGIDFIGGGELYTILKRYYKLPVALVKVFTAQIALALGMYEHKHIFIL
ncbi:hypothetical protein NQ315_016678 [Exocentrus adspersus]|uniref:Protein kinase domain-containing protein n=1 Tax=Exocentrus adspersus TaxID=1586481 RepID=A0AAV8VPP8_9CUCU|nr:hypothetical protein NQ315_016678 [Exocentrus adspersus]